MQVDATRGAKPLIRLVPRSPPDRMQLLRRLLRASRRPPLALETDKFVSFMCRYQPTGPGYSLVVPRRHVLDLHALSDDELQPTLEAVQRVSTSILLAFGVSGTTVMQNNRRPGQRVMHLHFHVVPRWTGDGYPCESDVEVDPVELERQAQLLRKHLRDPRSG